MSTDGPTIRPNNVHFFAKLGLRLGDDGGAGAGSAQSRGRSRRRSASSSRSYGRNAAHRRQPLACPSCQPQERQLLSAYARIENLPLRRAVLAVAE